MNDCEVCLKPTIETTTVTFADGADVVAAEFCRDCLTAVFKLMADRYNEAVDANNRAVADMMRIFRISH